jgi:hypothetical protein
MGGIWKSEWQQHLCKKVARRAMTLLTVEYRQYSMAKIFWKTEADEDQSLRDVFTSFVLT